MKNIILDTDMGPDCDDAGAAALLNIYKNMGYCNIAAIGHCTSNPYGAGTADAICRFYNNPDIPVGTYRKKGFLSGIKYMRYNKYITENFPNRYKNSQPEDAVNLYRRILSESEDKSIDFVSIGPLNNLSDLLLSVPDAYSVYTGTELIKRKVRSLTLMAGAFPSGNAGMIKRARKLAGCEIKDIKEYNVLCDIFAAVNVSLNWHTPKFYSGFETGLFETGSPMYKHFGSNHPVREAYRLYTGGKDRYSWDLTAVQFAADPFQKNFVCSEKGFVRFNSEGRTIFTPDTCGEDCFIELAVNTAEASENINNILLTD